MQGEELGEDNIQRSKVDRGVEAEGEQGGEDEGAGGEEGQGWL